MLYNKKHIYVRAPLRISFVGGGTDLESYYSKGKPGHVVSTTVDLYVYVAIKDMFDANVRVHHSEIETQTISSRITHDYVRTALEHFGLFRGAEVVLTSDVMTTGSGLGASSAIMGALLKGCSALKNGVIKNKGDFAELIYQLEKEAGTIGGKQDQYATVFGGFNSITFNPGKVNVNRINIKTRKLKELEDRLFLVFTNLARNSKVIQKNLGNNVKDKNKQQYFNTLNLLSHQFLNELESSNININNLGKIIHEGWMMKKQSNDAASNPYIDQLYDTLRQKGVIGGKILGAGGGGFFLAFAGKPELKNKIKYELYPNFITIDVKFVDEGAEILWKNF